LSKFQIEESLKRFGVHSNLGTNIPTNGLKNQNLGDLPRRPPEGFQEGRPIIYYSRRNLDLSVKCSVFVLSVIDGQGMVGCCFSSLFNTEHTCFLHRLFASEESHQLNKTSSMLFFDRLCRRLYFCTQCRFLRILPYPAVHGDCRDGRQGRRRKGTRAPLRAHPELSRGHRQGRSIRIRSRSRVVDWIPPSRCDLAGPQGQIECRRPRRQ